MIFRILDKLAEWKIKAIIISGLGFGIEILSSMVLCAFIAKVPLFTAIYSAEGIAPYIRLAFFHILAWILVQPGWRKAWRTPAASADSFMLKINGKNVQCTVID